MSQPMPMNFAVFQSVGSDWMVVATFAFKHDAEWFAKEYGDLQPNVTFRVESL